MTRDEIIRKVSGHHMEWIPFNDTRPAAILIPLIEREDHLEVVLEVRARGISQGGEICLPGGAIEDGETSLSTAIRETCEELHVDASQVEVIAPMVATSGPRGRMIETYLGFLQNYRGSYSRTEVDHILTIPLRFFYTTAPIVGDVDLIAQVRENFPVHLMQDVQEPWFLPMKRSYNFYEFHGDIIWGLTANILRRTAEIIYGDEHPAREYEG